jgi:hypothetical protein
MLAQLERTMIEHNRWVLATDDIHHAFDSVVIEDVLADHRRHLDQPAIIALVDSVLRGHEGQARKVGIDQGGAYSPTALNARLHFAHDLDFDRDHHPFWYRYADNLVYLCQDVSEGEKMMEKARGLLVKAGFTLKGEDGPPTDLRQGNSVQLLGFTLSLHPQEGHLVLEIGKDAWSGLEQALERAHAEDNPPDTALAVIRGWINAYGPAFEGRWMSTIPQQVLDTATYYGFRELAHPEELKEWWMTSYQSWCTFRSGVYRV